MTENLRGYESGRDAQHLIGAKSTQIDGDLYHSCSHWFLRDAKIASPAAPWLARLLLAIRVILVFVPFAALANLEKTESFLFIFN